MAAAFALLLIQGATIAFFAQAVSNRTPEISINVTHANWVTADNSAAAAAAAAAATVGWGWGWAVVSALVCILQIYYARTRVSALPAFVAYDTADFIVWFAVFVGTFLTQMKVLHVGWC